MGDILTAAARSAGSPATMSFLAGLDPAGLSAGERVDLVVAWERQICWVRAAQLPALAAVDPPVATDGPGQPGDWAGLEVGAALGIGDVAARRRLDVARALTGRLAVVGAAVRAGELTLDKAHLFVECAADLPDAVARAVVAGTLARAGWQTPGQLRASLRRAVLRADPGWAATRVARAAAAQRVTMAPLADGMAGVWAELPAPAAAVVMAGLDAEATRMGTELRAAGVGRGDLPSMDYRRAQSLLLWAERALAGAGTAVVHGRRPAIAVTVAASTLLGADEEPAELAGYGPIDAATARRLAAQGSWRRLVTDPCSGAVLDYGRTVYEPPADLREFVLARDPVCVFPTCGRPSRQCALNHVHAWEDGGATSADNIDPKCARHHTAKHEAGWQVSRSRDGTVTWTSPAGKTYPVPPAAIGPIAAQSRPQPPDCGTSIG